MPGERESALRRIAIVLSSLPAPIATRLLGDLDADSKHQVRRTMTSLADVDPLERKRALQAFSGTIRQQQSNASATTDEIVLTSVRRSDVSELPGGTSSHSSKMTTEPTDARDKSDSTSRTFQSLSFLGDVEDDVLIQSVSGEHPQTVALVLASIAPAQAARILPRLDPRLRSEAMSRIGRLGEIPAEMVDELAQHLRLRVAPAVVAKSTAKANNSDGQRRLDAILAAMPTKVPQALPVEDSIAFSTDLAFASDAETVVAVTRPLRVAPETRDGDDSSKSIDAVIPNAQSAPWSTDDIHHHLLRLKPVELREALAKVETRDALLSMCGLPIETTDAVLATLPRASARDIRTQMATIGPLQLRDIDEAKERVAIASLQERERSQTRSVASHVNVPLAA